MSATPRGQTDGATGPIISQFAADPDMRELVELFVGEMPGRLAEIERLWQARSMEELRRAAHQLSGASGGYGFKELGDAAGRLEQVLYDAKRQGRSPDESFFASVKTEVDALASMCQRVRVR